MKTLKSNIIISKNTIVTCPACDKPTARVVNDLVGNQLLMSHDLEPIDFNCSAITGKRPLSFCCSSNFFLQGKLHTDRGWLPYG